MLCSRRTLRWREVQAAISINYVDQVVDSARRLSMHLRDICGSLVEVLRGDRIEFVYVTAALFVTLAILQGGRLTHKQLYHGFGLYTAVLSRAFYDTALPALLDVECFEEQGDVDTRSRFAEEGYFAFQDYAVAHWTDHLLALVESAKDTTRNQPIDDRETSGAFVISQTDFM